MLIHEDFRSELEGIDLTDLDRRSDVIYGLRADLSVGMVTSSWHSTDPSVTPAAIPQGSVVDVLPGGLRTYYTQFYRGVLETRRPAEHDYLCPTPSRYRRFRMTCSPLRTGLLVLHRLLESRPHRLRRHPASLDRYSDPHGYVTMCAHCRQVQRMSNADKEIWDWVPDWVRQGPANVTHSVCPPCMDTYYS